MKAAELKFDARRAAEFVRKEAAGATHVLVGAALVRGTEHNRLEILAVVGRPGQHGRIIGIDLGEFEAEVPDYLMSLFDTVLHVRRTDSRTKKEGDEVRRLLVIELRRHFVEVRTCDDDLLLAEEQARLFPSAKSRRLLRQVRAEMAAIEP